jgi:hypothetical protein
MQHTVSYATEDGTTYRFQYDNETAPPEPGRPAQMHYLVFEDGTLKLEAWHHALPSDLTEDEFRSTVVLGAFFNCLGRTMNEIEQKEQLVSSPVHAYQQLATLINPHMRIRDEHVEWVKSVMERHHDAELYVKLVQDAQVEQFARELNAGDSEEPDLTDFVEVGRPVEEDDEDYVRPAHGKVRRFLGTYYPAIIWSVVFVSLVVAYVLTIGV